MADQEALTQESLNKIISERRLEIEQVASETSIPTSALLAATLITIPVVFGPVSLYIFSHYGTFAQFLPAFMHALLKYHAVQLNFLVISRFFSVFRVISQVLGGSSLGFRDF